VTDTEKLAREYLPQDVEARWYELWNRADLFRADAQSQKPPYCIVIPPPNVTGKLHMGHALFVTIQDLLTRFKRMQGFEALWLPGTDHAGIATQVMVERKIAKEGKTRHDLGRDAFLQEVWKWKEEKGGEIIGQMKVMGASCDWSRERFTMDAGLSAAVTEIFVRMHRDGLIYRAQRLVNWDPGSQTVLSDLEVEQEPEPGNMWHIAYPLASDPTQRVVVATTRPETMLGDTAVAVHPTDERYQALIGQLLVLPLTGRQIPIIADEMVDPAFGSGAVKITPAHDFNDFEVGKRHDLPSIQVIGLDARVTDAAPAAYQGLTREEARKRVVADLEAGGFLVKIDPHTYNPGRSQRSGLIVEPLPLTQWWVNAEVLAKPAIEAVEQGLTQIVPASWEKTYFNWMRNIRDWCISRQLWWGHQIPAWYRKDDPGLTIDPQSGEPSHIAPGAKAFVASSAADAAAAAGCAPEDLVRDPDVLDTWFSSGLWPFSTLGWPNMESPDLKKFYPTAVLETGFDILFFWVARMMMMGIYAMKDAAPALASQVPFKTVYLHAMIRDRDGNKMSKMKGNVVDPLHIVYGVKPEALGDEERAASSQLFEDYPQGISAQGADALRLTLAIYAAQGRDIRLDLKRVEGYRAFLNKLWQASRFVLKNLGDAAPQPLSAILASNPSALSLPDRWILDRLQALIEATTEALEAYRFDSAASAIYDFVWNSYCDWYIEFTKPVLHDEEHPEGADTARAVLLHVLETTLRLLHPIAPYVTEEIWQALPIEKGAQASICVAAWPVVDAALRAPAEVDAASRLISAVLALRNLRGESNIKPSQRIPTLLVFSDDAVTVERLRAGEVHIKRLARIDAVEYLPTTAQRPDQAATAITDGAELIVPFAGLIDVAEEIARLQKGREKMLKEVDTFSRKLANEAYTARAPAHIIQSDRDKLAAAQSELESLDQALARLSSPAA
jgi:valyl-tRNA synthetase